MDLLLKPTPRRLPALLAIFLTMATIVGCAHASWGDGGPPARPSSRPGPESLRYYYFIKSNYQEIDRDEAAALENMVRASNLAPKSYYLKMEAARLYARNGDNDTALKYAMAAIDLNPNAPEPRLFAAWVAASNHLWDLATSHYKEALRLSPGNQEALTYLGALYAETGRLDQAESTFKQLVATDPNHLSYYYLGSFYKNSKRPKEAINAFSESVKRNPEAAESGARNPEYAEALTELALLYEQQGDAKAAERTYRRLIKARPMATLPKARLATLLLKAGRKTEAEKLLAEISSLSLEQKNLPGHYLLGLIYLEQRLFAEAAAAFESVLKIDPRNDQARYLLATTRLELGEIPKAREDFAKIPKTSNLYVDSRLLLASTLGGEDRQKNLKEALQIISGAVKAKPDEPRLRVAQAMLLEEMDQVKRARSVILEAARKFPREAEIQFRLGVIEDKMGDQSASISAMRQAIRLNPDHADALNYLAYTWAERRENLQEALDLAERADALKPDSGYIIDTLGWIHYHLGNTNQALRLLERAVPLSSQDPVVLDHLGDVLLKLGRTKDALVNYRQALDGDVPPPPKLQEELNEKINRLSR